jgi:hypothetical protein
MTRIQNVKIGDPMGFKVNISSETDLNGIISALKTYHGGKYIVGKDTAFIDTPHYHIHWFAVKPVTCGALKTFRSGLGNKLTWLTRSDKLYTGQDMDRADPDRWIAYCIKEEQILAEGIEVTEKILILKHSAFENKRQNKVYSEKKAIVEKEKKDFKNKMFKYVEDNIQNYQLPEFQKQQGFQEHDKVKLLVIKFIKEQERYGSLKGGIIDGYVRFINIKLYSWDEFAIFKNIYQM